MELLFTHALQCRRRNSYQGYGGSSSSYSSPAPVYVDNPMNRGLERVGLERGSAPHSSSSASSCSPRTYVDNVQNRALDRVGMQHGTAVHSRSTGSTSASSSVSSVSTPKYVDNAQNQKLGRVGLERGSAPHLLVLISLQIFHHVSPELQGTDSCQSRDRDSEAPVRGQCVQPQARPGGTGAGDCCPFYSICIRIKGGGELCSC